MEQTSTHSNPNDDATMRLTFPVLATLALLSAAAPLATDMYLPSFPNIVTELHTTSAGVQFSLTAFFIGAGMGQVIFGPLSDRVGRRVPLLTGTAIYVFAGVWAAFSPTVEFLVIARFVQGLCGAAGMVISRAMIADLTTGRQTARAFSLMMLVGGIAPVMGPLFGGLLAGVLGWRGILLAVAAVGMVALAAAVFVLRESHPPQHRTRAGWDKATFRPLFTRRFACNALTLAFGFTGLLSYIAASPFLYQTMMGVDELQFGLLFGANALTLTVVGGLSARLTRRFSPGALARVGLVCSATMVASVALVVFSPLPLMWVTVPIPLAVGSLGLVFGNVTALALRQVPHAAGLGSAVLGLLQFTLAGSAAPLVSIGGENTAVPFVITMLSAIVLANVTFWFASRSPSGRG